MKLYEKYKGINFCDHCGEPLEHGQWLVGLCRACEQAAKTAAKTPRRGQQG